MFENRLRKMARHYGRWARRQGLQAYRIYDRDVPQFPVVLERYGDDYALSFFDSDTGMQAREPDYEARVLHVIGESVGVARDRLFARHRRRMEGGRQGEMGVPGTGSDASRTSIIVENGLRFEVLLSGRLDTGLFLDHRETRRIVREEASGRRFLNLFAYTGSFSVYAAAGGAASTTTVDLSSTNLTWAERNMQLNGFTESRHEFIESDVLRGIDDFQVGSFDLAVLDPPTFSRSRRMVRDFDVARDHPDLIDRTLRLLTPGGVLYFSSNLKKFRIQEHRITRGRVQDITARTMPQDFRMRIPHACYRIVRR